MIKYLILLLLASQVSAYELTGDNLIEPRYYEGNLLIFNDGSVSYSIFSNNEYLGTINPNQGIYVNETLNYSMYADYDSISDLKDVEKIKNKFNQWWILILIAGIILAGTVIIIKRTIK